jgi:cell division septal protein FtsQ
LLLIDEEIYMRISEIQYDPNEVDDKRFYLTMNDGNSVYLTLKTFEKLNNYLDILKEVISKYKDKKGILFLDEGEYFEVFND